MNKVDFLNNTTVTKFILFLGEIINGDIDINHAYYDRKKKEYINFKTLHDGLKKYHWNNKSYETNKNEIDKFVRKLTKQESPKLFYEACLDILEWGAGNNRRSLYTANVKWLKEIIKAHNVKDNLNDALELLSAESPCFTEFGERFRMNAGFTKIYALMSPSTFIIYDSRVAAALAFLVIKYCEKYELSNIPPELNFTLADAVGESCRNPSNNEKGYTFSKSGSNQQKHAISNVKANWILDSTFNKYKDSTPFKNIREIEAALFMIGYDFPLCAINPKNDTSSVPASKNIPATTKAHMIRERTAKLIIDKRNGIQPFEFTSSHIKKLVGGDLTAICNALKMKRFFSDRGIVLDIIDGPKSGLGKVVYQAARLR